MDFFFRGPVGLSVDVEGDDDTGVGVGTKREHGDPNVVCIAFNIERCLRTACFDRRAERQDFVKAWAEVACAEGTTEFGEPALSHSPCNVELKEGHVTIGA